MPAQMGRAENVFWNVVGGWIGQSLASGLSGVVAARIMKDLTSDPILTGAIVGLVVLFVLAVYRRLIGSRGPSLSVSYDPTGLVARKLQRLEPLIDLHRGDQLAQLLSLRDIGTHFLLNRPIESKVSVKSQIDHLDLWEKMVEGVVGDPTEDDTKKALRRFKVLGV